MRQRRLVPILPILAALTLAGCATPGGTPSAPATSAPSGSASPETPVPTVTVTATPSATPSDRGPDTEYDLFDAWLSCRDLTTHFYDDPGRVDFASFDQSDVQRRDDGLIYVYIETVDTSSGEARELASECILGGTLGDPNQALFGIVTRSENRDPNAPLPTA